MADIYAFDYNGTLTTQPGLEFYKSKARDPDTHVGVLTSNAVVNVSRFSSENNIQPSFVRRGFLKAPELLYISMFNSGDTVYVGNAARDKFASSLAGWDYIDVSQL